LREAKHGNFAEHGNFAGIRRETLKNQTDRFGGVRLFCYGLSAFIGLNTYPRKS
jgi:hypothetical protein